MSLLAAAGELANPLGPANLVQDDTPKKCIHFHALTVVSVVGGGAASAPGERAFFSLAGVFYQLQKVVVFDQAETMPLLRPYCIARHSCCQRLFPCIFSDTASGGCLAR